MQHSINVVDLYRRKFCGGHSILVYKCMSMFAHNMLQEIGVDNIDMGGHLVFVEAINALTHFDE